MEIKRHKENEHMGATLNCMYLEMYIARERGRGSERERERVRHSVKMFRVSLLPSLWAQAFSRRGLSDL